MADPILNQPGLAQQADTHPVELYLDSLAPSSWDWAVSNLNSIARLAGAADAWSFDWAALTVQQIEQLRPRLAERYARSTVNAKLSLLRGVYRACRQLGQIDADADLEALQSPRGEHKRTEHRAAGTHRDPHWLAQQAETHPVALHLTTLQSPKSRATAMSCLHTVARLAGAADAWNLDWAALTSQEMEQLRPRLAERYARSTVNQQLVCLRGVYRACRRLGQIDADADLRYAAPIRTERCADDRHPPRGDCKRPADRRHRDLTWLAREAQHHPVALYLTTLAVPITRQSILSSLHGIARLAGAADAWSFDWAALTVQDVQLMRTKLAERYALASANKMIVVLRGVLRACWQLGRIDADTYMRLSQVKPLRGHRLPAGRMLDVDECTALLRACHADPRPIGRRDAAILALMVGAGLRRGEITSLSVDGFDPDAQTVRVRGKGNKERIVPLPDYVVAAVEAWLTVRGPRGEALFVDCRYGHRPLAASGRAVAQLLAKRCRQAGIARCTPHDLRRTYISMLLDEGVDVFLVQRLAGHTNIATTMRYDRRGDDRLRAAVDRLPVP